MNVADCPIPRLVPYHRLRSYINSIDIGKLYSVQDELCDKLKDEEKVVGCYRSLEELLLRLVQFDLSSDLYQMAMFKGEINTFHVALGGDEAPLGKDDSVCSWLVSILNIKRGVLSSDENFLLFGATCSENCLAVKLFLKQLLVEIQKLERSTYSVVCGGETVEVKFVISELPNDMKMLNFLAGELIYYFTFGNVNTATSANCKGTFGPERSNTWQPWAYNNRLEVAGKVEKFKKSLEKKHLTDVTKRSKVTSYIASQKSRQEFVLLLGNIIDRAHVEPLHLKNNACALAHRHLLHLAIMILHLPNSISSFADIPSACMFAKYVETLRSKCFLTRLAKKVITAISS